MPVSWYLNQGPLNGTTVCCSDIILIVTGKVFLGIMWYRYIITVTGNMVPAKPTIL
jgi:hypothetical protein